MNKATLSTRLKQLPLRIRSAFAISCGLLLLLVVFSLKGCDSTDEPRPTDIPPEEISKPQHGTLKISENVEEFVEESVRAGKIFYRSDKQGEEAKPVVLNSEEEIEMELPPGKYRLLTIWELDLEEQNSNSSDGAQFSFRDPSFTIREGLSTPLDLTIAFLHPSWKHPKIPAVSGATTMWQGTFHRNPGSKSESSAITYKLKITTLNEEPIDQSPCRWLRVDVDTSSAMAPTVTETAFLALDIKEWEENQEFVVRRGWIQATSADIRTELETYASADSLETDGGQLPPLRQITLSFDPERDLIARKAIELEAPFPEDRLSLLDVLSLVMDADLEGASKLSGAMRLELSKLSPSYHRAVFKPNNGSLNCLAVRSLIVSDDLQFELLRNDVIVPFSLVEVKIKHPHLEASLKLHKHSPMETDRPVDPVDEAQLVSEADRLQALPRKTRFDLAAIPKEDGVQVDYTGTVTNSGLNGEISYSATVSALATEPREGRQCRWLKVEVTTTGSGEAEAAIVLVDPADYAETHKASILEGWLTYQGKDPEYVLPFALDGDMQRTEEDLQMLGFYLPQARLSVHDALFLLFNAQLSQSPSKFRMLRGDIEGQIESSTGRVMTRQELKLKDHPTIPGKVWTFKSSDGGPLNYTFKRSEKIPFSVFSMDLTAGPVKLSTKLNSYVVLEGAPAAFDKTEWENRAKETQDHIADWKEQNPNFRVWTITTTREKEKPIVTRLLAEWAGDRKPVKNVVKGDFYLKPILGEQQRYSSETQLTTEDEVWKVKERYWSGLNAPAEYVPEERILPGKAPEDIKVLIKGEETRILWGTLTMDEELWVRQANFNWYGR
jgi:hypothetical protein